MSEVVHAAPRRGEIPRVQIADLCEGCISLSNAEGFGERLFHFSYIAWIEEIPALIDRHKTLQRIPADNRLSPDFQNRQLAPVHQFSHCVPTDTRTFRCTYSIVKPILIAVITHLSFRNTHFATLQLSLYLFAISCQLILQPIKDILTFIEVVAKTGFDMLYLVSIGGVNLEKRNYIHRKTGR